MGNTYFISDLHLGAGYISDSRAHEQRVVRFLDSIANTADELILLGDVLDYWFEYRTVVPRGFIRFFGALSRIADKGVKITWFTGNHDIWLFDYLRDEIGLRVVDGSEVRQIYGHTFFLNHGDGVGRRPQTFRLIRSIFRNKVLQKLYSGIHPRWTIPFAHAWSSYSRNYEKYDALTEIDREEPLVEFCRDYLKNVNPKVEYFVFGHRHVLADFAIDATGSRMIILGDWIRHFSYGEFDGTRFNLKIFSD